MGKVDYAYILQDKTGYAVAVTIEDGEAMKLCKAHGWTYRMGPLHISDRTEIKILAPAIPK